MHILSLSLFFFALAFGFFRVYETNFRPSAARDVSSLLSELLVSIAAEFNDRAVNFMLLCTVAVSAGWFLRNKLTLKRCHLIFLLFPASLIAVRFLQAAKINHLVSRSGEITTETIKVNPLLSLIVGSASQHNVAPENTTDTPEFSQASLTSERLYPVMKIPQRKYNVVLYFFESTSTKWLSYRHEGIHEVTPNWNRLRRHALYAARHYANFPLSINGFFNVFCSVYALPDGHWLSLEKPDFPVKCASELLHEAGYRSAVLHASDPDYAGQRKFYKNRHFDLIMDNQQLKRPPWNEGLGPWGAADERALIEPAIQFARENRNNFFITLFAFNPHHPYYYGKNHEPLVRNIPPNLHWKDRNRLNYLNSLHFADRALGELVDRFETEGLADNTIFLILADHGEAFYEHPGNYNHPHFIYEENVRVPFLIYNRKLFPTGQTTEMLSSHIDVLPTMLDLLGLPPAPHAEGRSLLAGGKERLVDLQAFWDIEWNGIRDDRFKYMIRPQDGHEELYDLYQDPEETSNVINEHRELANRYRALTQASRKHKQNFFQNLFGYQTKSGRPSAYDQAIAKPNP